mmetsp:Transcript_12983/g.24758  ORF Transcript_12983/g.24758 Transcript_12983/m.24758 type:complete len:197 (-) Transcript_12983:375-965(-)|eukprot:CAMPEP_0114250530 /NCGR_PEP_ID=MMETSP0058-20121206/14750_1 /TAXON_ID=36894 /ORGANISM="Pyramimonas parkeae, CCMP726" /LENGTH=196 /DNA_ID=CAMNT_0001364199 /DNA_START=96 /DNA_END=686 /DNA_ORIENTATION=+
MDPLVDGNTLAILDELSPSCVLERVEDLREDISANLEKHWDAQKNAVSGIVRTGLEITAREYSQFLESEYGRGLLAAITHELEKGMLVRLTRSFDSAVMYNFRRLVRGEAIPALVKYYASAIVGAYAVQLLRQHCKGPSVPLSQNPWLRRTCAVIRRRVCCVATFVNREKFGAGLGVLVCALLSAPRRTRGTILDR